MREADVMQLRDIPVGETPNTNFTHVSLKCNNSDLLKDDSCKLEVVAICAGETLDFAHGSGNIINHKDSVFLFEGGGGSIGEALASDLVRSESDLEEILGARLGTRRQSTQWGSRPR